jgi:hypothetical protein
VRTWIAALGLVAACTQPVTHEASPPSSAQYEVRFPSTAAAVATDTLEVLVFDAAATGGDCLSLATARESGVDLPQSPVLLLDTGAVPICSITPGQAAFELPYGAVSFFAVAQRQGQDLFLGCTQTDLVPDAGPVDIWLAEAKIGTTLPATACMSLTNWCGGGC